MTLDLFASSASTPPQAGSYATIYADPPWLERGGGQIKRGADRHYALMKTRDICALPVSSWAAPNAHLYLWVTNNFLEDGLDVMRAWGFRYVTKIDWYKGYFDDHATVPYEILLSCIQRQRAGGDHRPNEVIAAEVWQELIDSTREADLDDDLQVGLGQYFRGCTESCLFGVRGQLPYQVLPNGKRAQGKTGFHAPRGEHSAKPEKMRQMIDRVSPGPRLEMFARRPADGWDLWGHEASPAEASA